MSEIIDTDTGEIQTVKAFDGHGIGKLAERLAKASLEIDSVIKDGYNAHFKYNYVTAEAIKKEARVALANHGISIFPMMRDVKSSNQNTRVEFDFIVTCEDAHIVIPWTADAMDKGDKGVSKCATVGLKSFLVCLLQIPTGNEDDTDADKPDATKRTEHKNATPSTPLTADDVAKAKAVEFTTQSGPVPLSAFDKDKFVQVVAWTKRKPNAADRPDIVDAVDVLARNDARIASRRKAFEKIGIADAILEHFENRYAAIAALAHSFVVMIDAQRHAPMWAKVYRSMRDADATVYEAATGADASILAQPPE